MTHTAILAGCGGGGSNAIRLARTMNDYSAFIIDDQDSSDIIVRRPKGVIKGFAGSCQDAREASAARAAEIGQRLTGNRAVVAVAALGGGAGPGTFITVSECARQQSMSVIAIVTIPFSFEEERRPRALQEAADLTAFADRTVIIDMQQLVKVGSDMRAEDVLDAVNLMAAEAAVTVARLFETVPFFSIFSQEVYSFSYGAGPDVLAAVKGAVRRPLSAADPAAGKLIVCPERGLSPAEAETVAVGVTDLTGIVPEIVAGSGEGQGVTVFMPTSFRRY